MERSLERVFKLGGMVCAGYMLAQLTNTTYKTI